MPVRACYENAFSVTKPLVLSPKATRLGESLSKEEPHWFPLAEPQPGSHSGACGGSASLEIKVHPTQKSRVMATTTSTATGTATAHHSCCTRPHTTTPVVKMANKQRSTPATFPRSTVTLALQQACLSGRRLALRRRVAWATWESSQG